MATFWIEGVAILVVGVFGVAGNILTVFVLRRIDQNTTFNRLLMFLGEPFKKPIKLPPNYWQSERR